MKRQSFVEKWLKYFCWKLYQLTFNFLAPLFHVFCIFYHLEFAWLYLVVFLLFSSCLTLFTNIFSSLNFLLFELLYVASKTFQLLCSLFFLLPSKDSSTTDVILCGFAIDTSLPASLTFVGTLSELLISWFDLFWFWELLVLHQLYEY